MDRSGIGRAARFARMNQLPARSSYALSARTMTQPTVAKSLLEKHGTCREQLPDEWSGNFELPRELLDFYRDVGPVDVIIDGYGNPTTFPCLKHLWHHQMGYRYHPTTNERFPDWDDSWIVFADEGGDAYIYYDGMILYAEHGTGKWAPEQIFDDIYTLVAAVATLGTVVTDAGLDLTDDDSYIRPHHKATAIDRLIPILGTPTDAENFVEFSGWGTN